MKQLVSAGAALALLCMALPAAAKGLKVGAPAPDFELTMIDGTRIRSSELRGQVVVLNFWATWCVPCRTELPLLDGYYRAAQRKGYPLRVFAVTTEDSVPAAKLKPLFQAMAIQSARRVKGGPFANVTAVPTNYVIDGAGILRYADSGSFDLEMLNSLLMPLMREANTIEGQ